MRFHRFHNERLRFDSVAWKRHDKALIFLDRVRERLEANPSSYLDDEQLDFTRETQEALMIIAAAGKEVGKENHRAQSRAARASNEFGTYLAFCRRRGETPYTGK